MQFTGPHSDGALGIRYFKAVHPVDHYDFEIAKYVKMFLAQQLNSSLHDNASAECTLALKFKIVIFSPHQQKAGQSKGGRAH